MAAATVTIRGELVTRESDGRLILLVVVYMGARLIGVTTIEVPDEDEE